MVQRGVAGDTCFPKTLDCLWVGGVAPSGGRSFELDSFQMRGNSLWLCSGGGAGAGPKGMLCSSLRTGCVQGTVQRGDSHSLYTSLRKKDPGAAALLDKVGHPQASWSGSGRLWPLLEWGGLYPGERGETASRDLESGHRCGEREVLTGQCGAFSLGQLLEQVPQH